MSWEDYQKGLNGIGGGSGMDYLKGVNERERDRAANKPQPPPTPQVPPQFSAYRPPPTRIPTVSRRDTGRSPSLHDAPATLLSMAKSGAGLLCLLFVGYILLGDSAWTLGQLIVGGAVAAAAGAVAGAALYVAVRILLKLLKIAAVLLGIGVLLDLANVIDLAAVLGRLGRVLGM